MRRGATTVVCLALLGAAVALLPVAGPGAAGAHAETPECSWQRHSKRVVKHVRRHGKRRRVVRTRHWWSCDAVSGTLSGAPSQPAPAPEPEPAANRLGVRASEYYFILSRPSVSAGEVTIELNDQGEDAHDLNLQREGSGEEPVLAIGETQSLQHSTAKFDLPAGTYKLWCSLPQHREKGMETTLVVNG